MKLDESHFAARDEFILDLGHDARPPTTVLYGGGYNRDRTLTARLHADTVLRVASRWAAIQTPR